jgi:hypothetical protein
MSETQPEGQGGPVNAAPLETPESQLSLKSLHVRRRAWDSNPRGRVNALAVFKTAAIGH